MYLENLEILDILIRIYPNNVEISNFNFTCTQKLKNKIQIQIQSPLFECQKTKSTNTCWSPFGDTK